MATDLSKSDEVVGELSNFLERMVLASDKEKSQLLTEILPVLSLVGENPHLQRSLAESNLDPLFACFKSTNRETLDPASDVLYKLGDILENEGTIIEKYEEWFKIGLEHPYKNVRLAHVKLIQKLIQHSKGLEAFVSRPGLSTLVAKLLSSDFSEATEAGKVLQVVASSKVNPSPLLTEPLLTAMKELSENSDSTVRFRCYDVMIPVAKVSKLQLDLVAKHGFLEKLCSDFETEDVLTLLNNLHFIEELVRVQHGLSYLEERSFLTGLESRFDNYRDQSLVMQSVLKLFGVVARYHPNDCLSLYPKFKTMLKHFLEGNDETEQNFVLETFAFICQDPVKKISLVKDQAHSDLVSSVMSKLKEQIKDRSNPDRVRGLRILTDLCILHDGVPAQREEESTVTEDLLSLYNERPLTDLMHYARMPITELSTVTHEIFLNLADHKWSLRLFNNEPGFMEFLLDRNVSSEKVILEMKHSAIGKAIAHPKANEIFSENLLQRMKAYFGDGPFFNRPVPQVAMDDM